MTDVIAAYHVSPRCIRVDFDGPMRNNDDLRDPTNYTIGVGVPVVTAVYVPTVQAAEYDIADPNPNGGKPQSVYLILAADPYLTANPILVTVDNAGAGDPADYYAAALLVANTANAITYPTYDVTWWNDPGVRVRQAFTEELPKLGKPKFGVNQPVNRSMAYCLAKLADLVSGGSTGTLGAAIAGPLDTIDSLPTEGYFIGGFGQPEPIEPGIGDTITFKNSKIPYHVDRLWGSCNGSNTLFRTSIAYHAFCCCVILVPPSQYESIGGELELASWYAPNEGKDRLLKLVDAPLVGYSVLAVYVPRQSLIRIDKEIIAYNESNLAAGTAIICGRSQLCSELQAHSVDDMLQDVWCESFVGRVQYNLLVFGASGRALEYLALEEGLSRSDNPAFFDTALRRSVFNTAVTNRATLPTVVLAFRYIYPQLWPYVLIGHDHRWPKCLTVWYHNEPINTDIDVYPAIEPWETWLDDLAYSDGFPTETYYNTYYRDPIGDTSYDGDYFLEGPASDDTDWPYPVVISGPDIYLIGLPAPTLPPPHSNFNESAVIPYGVLINPTVAVNNTYRNYMCRPYGLDRVLPAGEGVLLLDFLWLV